MESRFRFVEIWRRGEGGLRRLDYFIFRIFGRTPGGGGWEMKRDRGWMLLG